MMMWYGDGVSGWGYAMMIVGMIVFWGVVAAGLVLFLRSIGTSGPTQPPPPHGPTPQQILDERYARGEIDEEEYSRRRQTLTGTR